jgi:hypothetical protein
MTALGIVPHVQEPGRDPAYKSLLRKLKLPE